MYISRSLSASKGHTMQTLNILIAALIICLICYFRKTRQFFKESKIPSPPLVPFLGNAFYFMGKPTDIINTILNLAKSLGSPFGFWIGNQVYIVASQPEDIQMTLGTQKTLQKSHVYEYLKPLFGNGLLTSDVTSWKVQRKLIQPAFNQKMLNSFVPLFYDHTLIFNEMVKKEVGEGYFDCFHYAGPLMMDMVCESFVGVKMNIQRTNSSFYGSLTSISYLMMRRVYLLWYRNDLIFQFFEGRKHRKLQADLFQFLDNYIEQQKQRFFSTSALEEKKSGLDVLFETMKNGHKFSFEEFRYHVITFILAGTDTAAVTIGFMLILLGMHPEIQETLYEEVINTVGLNRRIEADDLPKLQYTERVLKETLRLFPPAPLIARMTSDDINLKGCLIPAGSTIVPCIAAVHRDPEIWSDPLKFDPDRFLPEESSKRHPCSWIPFAAGPRNCIGFKYAMMELKTVAAAVIRVYKVSAECNNVSDIKIKLGITVEPTSGHRISLELRE